MLDFQRIHLFQKRPWKRAISLLDQIVKISLLSQIIIFQVNAPFKDFLIVITNFLGVLSQKEDDFSWIINQVLRIFWFQALWKPRFENKGNFWINCVCIKALVSWYTHKGAFALIAYLQEDIRVMAYSTRVHLHHRMHQRDIRIMASIQGDICIMACTKGYIRIMTYLQGGLRIIRIPTRGHLHHCIPKWTCASWHTH